ncbi:hypothetical protein M0802_012552 [Mischocyttarus mexicanus]|nr:hypothetical protein M0802_012552 [Mischocyttarus mexicanus]
MRTCKSFCLKKQGKFPDLNENIYSCKCCRWYNLINGTSIKRKSNKIKRQISVRVSEDIVADLWKIQKVSDIVKSRDNRNESGNIEKLIQEETTSSSYVDAKNCFVQDAYTQSVCLNEEKGYCFECNIERKNEEINNYNNDDDDMDKETKKKYDETSLNCNCDNTIDIGVETLPFFEEENKSNITTHTITKNNNNNDLPYIPKLELEDEDDCESACNCNEYAFSKNHFKARSIIEKKNQIEIRKNSNTILKKFKQNSILNTRNQNHYNAKTNDSSHNEKSNKHIYDDLRSSTSTESLIYPERNMKVTRSNDFMFSKHLRRINKDSRRRNNYPVATFFRKINLKEDYSDHDYNTNRYYCHCRHFNEDTERKLIIEDKFKNKFKDQFEDTETNRSRTSFYSSTSITSYEQNESSSRSYFDDNNNYKCRELLTFRSSTSSNCTCNNLSSLIEYQRSTKFNPLSSTTIYNKNNNTLSVMQRRLQNLKDLDQRFARTN